MDFQVHEETYFLNLAEDENRWEVLVATATGARELPVYVDAPRPSAIVMLQDEKQRLPN